MRLKAHLPVGMLLAAVLVGLNETNLLPYGVQFNYPQLNNGCAALIALSIPVAIVLLAKTTAQRYQRFVAFVAAALLLLPALLVALLLVIDLASQDSLQDELKLGTTAYRVYVRVPALVTSQPFTVLYKEIDTPFGLKLVRRVWENERCGNTRLRQLDATTIEVTIDGDWFTKKIEI